MKLGTWYERTSDRVFRPLDKLSGMFLCLFMPHDFLEDHVQMDEECKLCIRCNRWIGQKSWEDRHPGQ